MNKAQKQDSLKEMLEILKGDYNFPVKLWIQQIAEFDSQVN